MRIFLLIMVVFFSCLSSTPGFCLSDDEIFDLLNKHSKAVNEVPFYIFIGTKFQGNPLPVSSYDYFQPFYYELKFMQPNELFATYQFPQSERHICFLLRGPNMYTSNGIKIWIFDKKQHAWQKPFKITESWGDAGYSIDSRAWLEDVDGDSDLDIIQKIFEVDMHLEEPVQKETTFKETFHLFIWDKDKFIESTDAASFNLHIDKYKVKEWEESRNTLK